VTRPEHDIEYERRFLVEELPIRQMTASERIVQGYIWAEDGYAVRARRTWIIEAETEHETTAILTVKGPRSGHQRWEQEIAIPSRHAQAMIARSIGVIEKTRYGAVSEGNT
jgi:adenylate cyclase